MKEIKVTPINDGTVIDHISPGMALDVLKILGLGGQGQGTVSVLINARKRDGTQKDVVKIEGRELKKEEVTKIALISPGATINIIRNFEVAEKYKIPAPANVLGLVKCGNPNCITNQAEPVVSEFSVVSNEPTRLKCAYCERELEDVHAHLL